LARLCQIRFERLPPSIILFLRRLLPLTEELERLSASHAPRDTIDVRFRHICSRWFHADAGASRQGQFARDSRGDSATSRPSIRSNDEPGRQRSCPAPLGRSYRHLLVFPYLGARTHPEGGGRHGPAVDLGLHILKGATTPSLWWHQDWWCWDHPISFVPTAPQIAVLCYLCDTSDQTGALRVLPGSHLRSLPIRAQLPEPHSASAEHLASDHPALNDVEGQVTLSLSRGDAVVIDYRLLHGTHPNRGASRRDALLLSFTPHWCLLPDEIRAHLIMHPALPTAAERSTLVEKESGVLPWYDGTPASLRINRRAPV
jgi:hypothetical protein